MDGLGDPLTGFLGSLPHVHHFDQADAITLGWLPAPDVIQLAPCKFIDVIPIPPNLGQHLPSKAITTWRQGHGQLD